MLPDDIDQIESRLGVKLPRFYVDFVTNDPKLRDGRVDGAKVYNDPRKIIAKNEHVHRTWLGEATWPDHFFAIGESLCGDPYAIRLDGQSEAVFRGNQERGEFQESARSLRAFVHAPFYDLSPDVLVALYGGAPDPSALEGLSAVDWSAVQHAYGPADDVPVLLRALSSDNPEHREFAEFQLCQTIWHQGTVYEATAKVVPFLYALLGAEGADRSAVLGLLGLIVDGTTYLEVHTRTPESEARWRSILAKKGKTLEQELAQERAVVEAIRRAVGNGIPRLRPYLHDPEPTIRGPVVDIARRFPEHTASWLSDLQAAYRAESDEEIRELLWEAIDNLSPGDHGGPS
jgi:hypothetical protein